MLLTPDPHSQYGSGSRTAKSMGIHADPDPQKCFSQCTFWSSDLQYPSFFNSKKYFFTERITDPIHPFPHALFKTFSVGYSSLSLMQVTTCFLPMDLHNFRTDIQNPNQSQFSCGTYRTYRTKFSKIRTKNYILYYSNKQDKSTGHTFMRKGTDSEPEPEPYL